MIRSKKILTALRLWKILLLYDWDYLVSLLQRQIDFDRAGEEMERSNKRYIDYMQNKVHQQENFEREKGKKWWRR